MDWKPPHSIHIVDDGAIEYAARLAARLLEDIVIIVNCWVDLSLPLFMGSFPKSYTFAI